MKKILILGSVAPPLIHFRGDFIKSLVREGYEVFAAAPLMEDEVREGLQNLGATPLTFQLSRAGMNPFKDLRSIWGLKRLMKTHQIDLVFPYTIKPVIYASLAARMLNIPVVSLITGLGFTFSGSSRKARILQQITQLLYRFGLKKNKIVIFQNPDDLSLFLERNLISKQQRTAIVNGSGVNLNNYRYRVNEKDSANVIFVLMARLIHEKGVNLYLKAAQNLKNRYPKAEFHIIGEPDHTPSAVKLEVLQDYHNRNVIVYHGFQKNIPERLYNSDIFVLPTFYREGIPRSILEALSIGMPVITTNTPGCRETIIEGQNGYLIPPNDMEALQNAMQKILDHPEHIKSMGITSRKMAEEKFDVQLINKELIEYLKSV